MIAGMAISNAQFVVMETMIKLRQLLSIADSNNSGKGTIIGMVI